MTHSFLTRRSSYLQAIENGEIWVAYQPKLDLATGRIVGAEGLARWTHPEKGEISPNQFIPAAEQSERIEPLTRFVLDTAVAEAAALNKRSEEHRSELQSIMRNPYTALCWNK